MLFNLFFSGKCFATYLRLNSISYFSKVFFPILLAFARVSKRYFKETACLFESVCFPKRCRLIVGGSNRCYSKEITNFFFFYKVKLIAILELFSHKMKTPSPFL